MAKYTEVNKKWNDKNEARKLYINKRSTTKNFILNLAIEDDLEQIEKYIEERHRLKSILKKDTIICKEIKWDASSNKKCISFLFVYNTS